MKTTVKRVPAMGDRAWVLLIILALIAAVGAGAWLGLKRGREWDAYKAEHNCKEVSRKWRGSHLEQVPIGNGQTMQQWVDEGDSVTYLCDNGYVTR